MQFGCRDLTVGYEGKAVLTNVNFVVNAGAYLSIIGENGSGKSTLMRTLLQLQKPISGEIILEGNLKRNAIGYLPQQTAVQKDFPASVQEIVLSGCQNRCGLRPFYSHKDKQRAHQMMEKMQITHLAKRCYRELSGGQQQRVLLARALCATQDILLLDEPTAGLDSNMTEEMYQLIAELNQKDRLTVIMISHDMQAVLTYSSHILHIGETVFFGTREEYTEKKVSGHMPEMTEVYHDR